jgi:transposase InsO family protein
VSTVFAGFDAMSRELAMADNMRAELPCASLRQAAIRFYIRGAVIHSDCGGQYTSSAFKALATKLKLLRSMNSAGGRCYDNSRCESQWGRFKVEKIYQINSTKFTIEEMKTKIFAYFMGYWSNRRICSAIGGMPPAEKRRRYFEHFAAALSAKPI